MQIQRIAGNPLELSKLQHKYEIKLSAKSLKIRKIGQSAAESRIEKGSTTIPLVDEISTKGVGLLIIEVGENPLNRSTGLHIIMDDDIVYSL